MTKSKHTVIAIVAFGDNFEIGCNGDLIWHIKEDLKRFKQLTMGHPIIMGRKTRDSLPKALPGRTNIVVTRNPDYTAQDSLIAHSIEDALKLAREAEGSDKIYIIGGGQIYEQAWQYLDEIEVTHIYDNSEEADTFFPKFSPEGWELFSTSDMCETADGFEFKYESYRRIKED